MTHRLSRDYLLSKCWQLFLSFTVHPPRPLFEVQGYLHPLEGRLLYWLGGQVPPGGRAVEIGSFKGKSSGFIAAGLPKGASLACIDTWLNDAMPYDRRTDVMGEFMENIRAHGDRIEPVRSHSTAAASSWSGPVDLLFIDGDHSYEGCAADLRAWLPFLRAGGWLALHDSAQPGVRRALQEELASLRVRRRARAWSITALQVAR